jgi:hypothetical protein
MTLNCRSKYHAKKVTYNGITYDSKKEANRHRELLLLERAGAISELERQVRYELLPSQRIDGKVVERPVFYIADFRYQQDGKTIVEDTKGVKTKDYILKRKMLLYFHKIKIKEV